MDILSSIVNAFLSAFFSVIVTNVGAIASFFVATALGAAALIFTYRSYRVSKIQSSPKKVSIDVYGGLEKSDFIVTLPFRQGVVYAFPFVLTIHNKEDRAIEGLELMLDLPEALYRGISSGISRSIPNWAIAREMKQTEDPVNGTMRTNVYYKVGIIPPKTPVKLVDTLFCDRDTILKIKTDALTKDKVKVVVSVEVPVKMLVAISVFGKDVISSAKKMTFQFRNIEIENFFEEDHAKLSNMIVEEEIKLYERWKHELENLHDSAVLIFNSIESEERHILPNNSTISVFSLKEPIIYVPT